MQVVIDEAGRVDMVYSDLFAHAPDFNDRNISRLSEVEPNSNGLWQVKFLDEKEPRKPEFALREDALDYERAEAEKKLIEGVV